MKTIRVGVIGLGVGEQHARTYQADPKCMVVALCDLFPEKLSYIQPFFPEAIVTKNAEDIIENADIDIISIASYDDTHFSQVIQSLESGKHVFVEKPLCQTLEEATHIKKLWVSRKKNQKIDCNLILREAPLYKWLRESLKKGEFGDIYAIDGEYLYGRLHKITQEWRSKVENYSVMEGGGIHMIDLMLWLTGDRPVSVISAGNRICSNNTPFKYNDFVTSIMEFENGMIGRITANFGCVHRHQHIIRIYGTKATFVYDDIGPRIYTSRNPDESPVWIKENPLPASKGERIPSFISAILNKKDISDEVQTIFDGISICTASDRSIQTQKRELIHYI